MLTVFSATARAMLEALTKLASEKHVACAFYDEITANPADSQIQIGPNNQTLSLDLSESEEDENRLAMKKLNESQVEAIRASGEGLTLIWGPPGADFTYAYVLPQARILIQLFSMS